MKTAVVHDWLNGMRGGEKVLEAILPLVPEPTIFTLFHVPGSVSPAIERHPIVASALNHLPFARSGYRNYLPLFPKAVESFDLSSFDFVVSSSHCVAKGAIARDGAPHLSYCHTPVRYAYEQFDLYFPPGRTRFRRLKAAAIGRLRAWDVATAGRPTRYLANSSAVAARILRHYGRESEVCHPPVDVELLSTRRPAARELPPRRRRARSLQALRGRDRGRAPSWAAGSSSSDAAPRRRRLRTVAPSSVDFVAGCSPERLRDLYRTCAMYVQPGEEDFGIAAVEALACGAPVVALGRGGARDIVRDGENGALYGDTGDDGPDGLAAAVTRAASARFDYTRLRGSALPFRPERFAERFQAALRDVLP